MSCEGSKGITMSNVSAIEVIDLGQLALVSGGQGPAEQAGQRLGQWGGRAAAELVPPQLRPPARVVLPPVGAEVGRRVGQWVDSVNPFNR